MSTKTPVDKIKCPPNLSAVAKKEFKRLMPELQRVGYMAIDQAALEMYLEAYSQCSMAREYMAKHGTVVLTPNGSQQVSPYHTLYRQNSELLKKWTQELGLSPGSRKRLGMELRTAGGGKNSDLD